MISTQDRLQPNFICSFSGSGGDVKVFKRPGQMSNMSALPIYGKKTFNSLLQNLSADCFETWYVVLDTRLLPRFLNEDLGMTSTF